MLKQNTVQKQIAWARSLLTVSRLTAETDDVSKMNVSHFGWSAITKCFIILLCLFKFTTNNEH